MCCAPTLCPAYICGQDIDPDPKKTSFYLAMQQCEGVLLVLDEEATATTRIWCCFEEVFFCLYVSHTEKKFSDSLGSSLRLSLRAHNECLAMDLKPSCVVHACTGNDHPEREEAQA